MSDKLLACPFCGGEIHLSPCLGQDRYDFNCNCEYAISIWAESEAEAIKALHHRFVCPDKNGVAQAERELIGHALALQTYLQYIGPLPGGDAWDKFFKACDNLRKAAALVAEGAGKLL